MTATATPRIAHGIARIHPDAELDGLKEWGPEWELPSGSGRWVIDRNYNVAVRVILDDSLPADRYRAGVAISRAMDALSAEEEARRVAWLSAADRRETEAFVRKFTARRRREYGTIPAPADGDLVRGLHSTSAAWHIARGTTADGWPDPDVQRVVTYCSSSDIRYDLGYVGLSEAPFQGTTDADVRVCRLCSAKRGPGALVSVGIGDTAAVPVR